MKIGRKTWIKRNRCGQRVGSICQFPLIPAYAVTCHKSQGLTLPAAVNHCSREYVPGLIYVAVSRVRGPEFLQVINFYPDQLLTPERRVIEHCRSQHTCNAVQDLSCCRKNRMADDLFRVQDRFSDTVEESEDQFTFPMEMMDWPAFACFEEDGAPITLELTEVFEQLSQNESYLATPSPDCFDACRDYLESLKRGDSTLAFVRVMSVPFLIPVSMQSQKEQLQYSLRPRFIGNSCVIWFPSLDGDVKMMKLHSVWRR